MSDLSKHLPLSNRAHGDEAGVSSDRRAEIADLLLEAARVLAAVDPGARIAASDQLLAEARLTREAPAHADPVTRLLLLADGIRSGRKRGVRALVRTARGVAVLAATAKVPVAISSGTCGEIALWAATSGPFERRVVLAGHTIRATDAEWSFGRGPILEGTARGIADFALGVSDTPPQPPVSSPR